MARLVTTMLFVVVTVVSLLSSVRALAAMSFDTGSSVYQLRCSGCHGSAGEGIVGPSLQDSTLPLASVISQITNGAGTMPSFADELTAADIEAVAAFVMTFRPPGESTTTTEPPTTTTEPPPSTTTEPPPTTTEPPTTTTTVLSTTTTEPPPSTTTTGPPTTTTTTEPLSTTTSPAVVSDAAGEVESRWIDWLPIGAGLVIGAGLLTVMATRRRRPPRGL